jgi:polyhydroxyalkanoate synthesis repressor PhaR
VAGLHRSMDARTIRKYGNRRLYDTTDKRYVNLDEIAGMIREGAEIKVVDAKTGEDLTRSILTQIIVEETKSRNGGLPLEILRELVALSDRAKHAGLVWYLRSALETYRRAQHMPVEFMRNLFVRPQEEGEEISELRQRVEELERQLSANQREPESR